MSAVRRFSKSALRSLGVGLNRLDELGGEARDRIVEWLDTSPSAARIKAIARRRRDARDHEIADAVAADVAARQADAPAEAPSSPPAPLGEPSLPAQIYGKRSCPWSGRAVRLLEDRDVELTFVDLDDSENDAIANRLIAETKQNTVPYIFIRGQFIGGFNALSERDRLGQLRQMIDPDAEQPDRIAVEVAERPNTDEVAPGEN